MTRHEVYIDSSAAFDRMFFIFRDALIVTSASVVVGLLVNLVHPEKIPYITKKEYEILVPCPEPGGEVTKMAVDDPKLFSEDTFVVDARPKAEFAGWRFRDATNVTYDYLDPTPPETLRDLAKAITHSRAKRVVVYGDGDTPDTGEQLGKEISGFGIKNVCFLKGGAPVLKSVAMQSGGGQQ